MRTFVVELAAPPIKLSLLRCQILSWGTGRLCFERFVHPLVLSVLFGMGRLSELRPDAHLDPPDGEARKSAQGDRGERNTVVGANGLWQSIFSKQPFECEMDRDLFGRPECFASEDVSAVLIGDGQRIAVVAIARQKLAFEVGG